MLSPCTIVYADLLTKMTRTGVHLSCNVPAHMQCGFLFPATVPSLLNQMNDDPANFSVTPWREVRQQQKEPLLTYTVINVSLVNILISA